MRAIITVAVLVLAGACTNSKQEPPAENWFCFYIYGSGEEHAPCFRSVYECRDVWERTSLQTSSCTARETAWVGLDQGKRKAFSSREACEAIAKGCGESL